MLLNVHVCVYMYVCILVSGPVPSVNCIEVCNSDLLALKELMLQYHTDVKVSLQNPVCQCLEYKNY